MKWTMPDEAQCQELERQIGLLLHGRDPALQSAVLADLLAMWLAGHFVADDSAASDRLRAALLSEHLTLVRDLIPINAKQIHER